MRLFTLLTVTLLIAAPASAQVQLRFKFTPGETIRQKMIQEMKSAADVQGQKVNTAVTQTIHTEQAIDSVDSDGTARVRQTIARIQMSMQAPFGQGFKFDSAEEAAEGVPPVVSNLLNQLAGAEFQAKVSPLGKLSEITIPEDLQKSLTNVPGSPFGSGADSLEQLMGQSPVVFPDNALSKGDSWSDETTMKMAFGAMKVRRINTYEGTNEDGLHVIDMDLDLELAPTENQGLKMTIKDSNAKGTLLFDNEKGQLVHSELRQNITMEASAAGQTFNVVVEQNVIVEQDARGEESKE